ncbi:hypothetical protein Hanom_Chr03g00186731 [Helianthus anomalus]
MRLKTSKYNNKLQTLETITNYLNNQLTSLSISGNNATSRSTANNLEDDEN